MQTQSLLALWLALAAVPSLAQQSGDRALGWEDDDGTPHYSDSYPPEAADRDKTIHNQNAVAVGKIRPGADPQATLREIRSGGLSDTDFLTLWGSIEDIRLHYERSMTEYRSQVRSGEASLNRYRLQLGSYEAEARDSSESDAGLQRDIASTREQIDTLERHVSGLERLIARERQRRDRDVARFQQLKGVDESGHN